MLHRPHITLVFGLVFVVALSSSISGLNAVPANAQQSTQIVPPPAPKSILILFSAGFYLPAYRKNIAAFFSVMEDVGFPVNQLHIEYLDLIRNNGKEYRRHLLDLLERKYADKKLDLIITVEGLARDFILKEARDLQPETPIVSILSADTISAVDLSRQIVQIPSILDLAGSLKLALVLFPQTKRVFVVLGTGEDERRWEVHARNQLAPWVEKLEFEYSSGLTYEDMLQRIGSLPPETIVLYIALYRDKTGRSFVPKEVAIAVTKEANRPVFGVYDEVLPLLVGGSMISYGAEGARVAKLAIEILNGTFLLSKPITTLPILISPYLNWKQLDRWGISSQRLPEGSILINRPTTIWDDYKEYVIGFVALIALQAGMIISLLGMHQRRKKADLERSKAEERYRRIVETAREGIWAVDSSFRTTFVNKKMADILGNTPEVMTGQTMDSFIYTEDLEAHHRSMEILRQGMSEEYESRWTRKDGKLVWTLVCAVPLLDDQGGFSGLFGMFTDITERKLTEEKFKQAHERLNTVINSIEALVYIADIDNHELLFVNDYGRRVWGEIVGRKCWEAIQKDQEGPCTFCTNDKLLDEDGNPSGVYAWEFQNTVTGRWYDCRDMAIQWIDGRLVRMEIATDITERKRAEEALRQSEERYRLLIDTANEGIWSMDGDHRTTYVNKAMADMLGYAPSEMLGKRVEEFFFSEDMSFHEQRMGKRHAGVDEVYERRFRRRDGSPLWTLVSAKALKDPEGSFAGSFAMFTDITAAKRAENERRALEERLLRAEKMEALGTLAGGVAHDLNNVLGIVVGYSELLLDDLDESSSARSGTMEVLKAGQRAAAIVQDLLTLARRGITGRKVLNLNKIILECMNSPEFAKILSYHPNIEIKTDFEVDLLNVSGSSVHLGKSFLNLVFNAAEAMVNGGILTVKTASSYLDKPISGYDEVREGDYVVLNISDTGEGIPASDLKRIFEPFYTRKVMGRSGTGLGLAVVWGTVKDHHGYINVESKEGKGSTFTLYFPVTREDISPEEVAVSASEYMGNGESILIVDDVKEQRELAGTMLKKLNYTVASVSSGEEAVEYVREHRVSLVVLDMIMDPGMDGLDTYTRILKVNPHQKAIIVSGFSETERVIKAQELGAGAYVKKPYVLEKLGLAVRKELERSA